MPSKKQKSPKFAFDKKRDSDNKSKARTASSRPSKRKSTRYAFPSSDTGGGTKPVAQRTYVPTPKKQTILMDPKTNDPIDLAVPSSRQPKKVTLPQRPSRNLQHRQSTIDECIAAEKNKPWINGFEGTYIKLGPGQESNNLFMELINPTVEEQVDNDGTVSNWYRPSDNFYKIMCKESGIYNVTQTGSLLTIRKSTLAVQEQQIIITVANKIKLGSKSYIIPESNEYKSARMNYFKNRLDFDENHVDILLSTSISKAGDIISALKYKIAKYLELFELKVSKQWLADFTVELFQKAREENQTIKKVLGLLVQSTLFLRNEFDRLNKNLIMQINKGIIMPNQILTMSQEELLPELFQNTELQMQLQEPELLRQLNELKEATIKNLASNIVLYRQIQEKRKFKTALTLPQLQPNIDSDKEIIQQDEHNLAIDDIIPIQNLKTIRIQTELGKQASSSDLDKLGEFVFYKDEDNKLYCFDIKEIKQFVDQDIVVNPLSSKPFRKEFLHMIKKLNLTRVFPAGYLTPWKPQGELQETLFGAESDPDSDAESEISQADSSSTKLSPAPSVELPWTQWGDAPAQQSSTDTSAPRVLVGTDFLSYVEQYIARLEQTPVNIQQSFSFDDVAKDVQESMRNHYCESCSKRLTDLSTWSRTVNMNKKNGEFNTNTYHIKCLYDAPFKI